MHRVLLMERNARTTGRLVEALRGASVSDISLVPGMRDACRMLFDETHELAIVPMDEAPILVHSLRALQPKLRVVITAHALDAQIPRGYEGLFQGILHMANLERELPAVLERTLSRSTTAANERRKSESFLTDMEFAELADLFRRAEVADSAQYAVLSHESEVIAFGDRLSKSDAKAIADATSQEWDETKHTARVQFVQLADSFDPFLLYSRPINHHLLTVAAPSDISIRSIRRRAESLMKRLADLITVGPVAIPALGDAGITGRDEASGEPPLSFALAWRPVKTLPASMQGILREMIEAIAAQNYLVVTYLDVDAELLRLVVSCPADRSSVWVADLFMGGVERAVQKRFGVSASLWAHGYYAKESSQPLAAAEVAYFLPREM